MLDRALQLRILSRLEKTFLGPLAAEAITTLHSEELRHELAANLEYLSQHGLVQAPVMANAVGPFAFRPLFITAKGLDFMADDGGLGAILNVQVVKIHVESIRELLQVKVDQSALPEAEKSELKKKVSAMSTAAIDDGGRDADQGRHRAPAQHDWLASRALIGAYAPCHDSYCQGGAGKERGQALGKMCFHTVPRFGLGVDPRPSNCRPDVLSAMLRTTAQAARLVMPNSTAAEPFRPEVTPGSIGFEIV